MKYKEKTVKSGYWRKECQEYCQGVSRDLDCEAKVCSAWKQTLELEVVQVPGASVHAGENNGLSVYGRIWEWEEHIFTGKI